MGKNILLIISGFLFVFFISCGKEDPTDIHEYVYEKKWYNTNYMGVESNYFDSDGTFNILPNGIHGTYYWGVNDSMHLESVSNGNFTFHFMKIEKDEIWYWPTNTHQGTIYKFSTEKP